MAFIRKLNERSIAKMTGGENAALFARLKEDVLVGEVFPAVRVNELHFYYRGGCLFKFAGGTFSRDARYGAYGKGGAELSAYERAKSENEVRFTNRSGGATERQLLDRLQRGTFGGREKPRVVVLDLEVNLGGKAVNKCDLVLLNTETDELMFVEGKVYSDRRVKCAVGYVPEVIGQVRGYSAALAAQRQTVVEQYGEAVRVLNRLFGTDYLPPQKLAEPAKLLVYRTGGGREENVRYTVETIEGALGRQNVMWVGDEEPTPAEIWDALTP